MMKNAIWITGAEGRLGKKLVKTLKKDLSNIIFATDVDVDITDLKSVEQAAKIYKPTMVINCASLSDADYCESHRVEAYRVNALGARNMAAISRQYNARIIHLSTDDVFSGENLRAKNEFDVPTPKTVYGQSKLAGEAFVRELNPKHLIIRSSWVYGAGADYFSYVAEKGKNGEAFEAAVDQISSPTSVDELVQFFKALINSEEYGIFHASCEGMCSRHEFATAILSELGYDTRLAKAVIKGDTGSTRSTVLENLMMEATDIYTMPTWDDALKAYVSTLK